MSGQASRRFATLPWHGRFEARVVVAVGFLMAVALVAMLVITVQLVSTHSRTRAEDELGFAWAAFTSLMDSRGASSVAATTLVTELPVFRAHLTDSRLAADRPTIDAMADGYRRQLEAEFVIVTSRDGRWLANPGWNGDAGQAPAPLAELLSRALRGSSGTRILGHGAELFLVVAAPARFADEVLGTLIVGYQLNDRVADQLSLLAQCEVVLVSGTHVAASSLDAREQQAVGKLARETARVAFGVLPSIRQIASHEYVGGVFPLERGGVGPNDGRLLLLADLQPTQLFVNRLRGRFLIGGLAVFGFALTVGLLLSRRVTRPLREIAAAASDIAAGNLALELPVRGSVEDMTVAQAFNEMSASLRAAHARLVHDAIHDPLTQLPNRVLFMERLERAIARRMRHNDYTFAVLFIDLDRFKHVNDSLGHTVGDRLLVAFSERLASVVRHDDTVTRISTSDDSDTLARFGGDEFVLLIDDIREPIDAVRVAERVQALAERPLPLDAQEFFVSPSIGVAVCSSEHRSAEDVVRDADAAMYRAKEAGGGRYAVFDAAMHQQALDRMRLETELRRAMERQEFRLWYQPIVSLSEQRVAGFEALIRWQHPERGLLDPGAFLRVAEELGLIAAMDEWGLGEACRQAVIWRQTPGYGDITVSVNVSAKGFGSDTLVASVEHALERTGLPPAGLSLEITESVAISDTERVRAVLKQLRALGVRVSLDDFGTGYCSLSYLQQFAVNTLKIDRSFVARIGEDEGDGEIIRLIVGLAKTLGLDVVAEGTETRAQVEYLASLGCGFGQGYYFAKPMAPELVVRELARPA